MCLSFSLSPFLFFLPTSFSNLQISCFPRCCCSSYLFPTYIWVAREENGQQKSLNHGKMGKWRDFHPTLLSILLTRTLQFSALLTFLPPSIFLKQSQVLSPFPTSIKQVLIFLSWWGPDRSDDLSLECHLQVWLNYSPWLNWYLQQIYLSLEAEREISCFSFS